jgi:hypothetical protein
MVTDLIVRDVPIVIDPGINIIEAACEVLDQGNVRKFPIQLFRLALDKKVLNRLPFVPATTIPHVFSPVSDVRQSPLLLVFDHLGRLAMFYKRCNKNAWERYEVYDETVGRTVITPSVRFRFNSEKTRDRFMRLSQQLISQSHGKVVNYDDVQEFVGILGRMRAPPVSLPVVTLKPVENVSS